MDPGNPLSEGLQRLEFSDRQNAARGTRLRNDRYRAANPGR
jgi:hypothetical protein